MRAVWVAVASAALVGACAPAALPTRPPGELFRGIEAPPDGAARVYIFRPGFSRVSETDNPTLSIDGKEIARLSIESHTSVTVKPGTYSVSLKPNAFAARIWEGTWRMTISAGDIYFLAVWNDVESYKSFTFAPLHGVGFLFLPTSEVRNRSLRFEPVTQRNALPVISETTYVPPLVKSLEPSAP